MNREQRRRMKKDLGKELSEVASDIARWTNLYEGKDNETLEKLIAERIKPLSPEQLLRLAEYLEQTIRTE